MEKIDIAIIGAGAIGLGIAHALSEAKKDIIVIEKNHAFGQETSSRNSEVIHAGIYYPKDSFKAKTCIRGRGLLYKFCSKHNIPYKKLGKLIVASEKSELDKLKNIHKNAGECGVEGIKFLDKKDIEKLEPSVRAESALFSSESGIFDTHAFMKFLFSAAKINGVNFSFSVEATNIKKKSFFYEVTVKEPGGDSFSFESRIVINCAGLWADMLAGLLGIDIRKYAYKIHYCKGQYFRIRNPKKFSIKHLVYPPPSEIDLGIHVTPDTAGGLRLGPDVRYVKEIDYNINEGDKKAFFHSVKKFLPNLELDDIIPDTAGVRPKLQGENDAFRDFVISEESEKGFPNFVNLIGIESPGLTSSLAIAEIIKKTVDRIW